MKRGRREIRWRWMWMWTLPLVLLGAGAPSARSVEDAPKKSPPPNLLIVTFDTTRADRLPIYGYKKARTPAIERLAREGTVFTRAYAPAVQTLPSHASLFTGLFPITTNVVSNGQRLAPEALTLAEVLQSAGYRTGAVVATAPLMSVFGLAQGFDTYDDNFEDTLLSRASKALFRLFSANRVNIRATRPAPRVAALARAWLRQSARSSRPFFLWVHFIEPHSPYQRHPDVRRPNLIVDDGPVNEHGEKEANYVNEIEFADRYLGQILRQLDDLELTQKTLTVLTADHGESLGEQGYTGHREEVFERIIRVPLVMRMPGRVPAGQRLETPAQLLDVMPTVLSLLGGPGGTIPMQGQNLLELPPHQPRKLFAMAARLLTREPIRIAAIHGSRKYVTWPESGRRALYDIAADPEETRNLLGQGGRAGAAADLAWAKEIQAWWDANDRLTVDAFVPSAEHLERLRSLGYVRR